MRSKSIQFFFKWLGLIGIFISTSTASFAQNAAEKTTTAESSPIREEIQRYVGYEDLLPRYVSLPYDVTMNTNVAGEYVDISFILLMFLPLLFLMGSGKRPWVNLTTIAGLLTMLIIAIPTGYSNRNSISIEEVGAHLQNYLTETSFAEQPVSVFIAYLYQLFNALYQPFLAIFNSVSGQSDYITYPLLIALFLGILNFINLRIEHHSLVTKSTINVLSVFSLLWFVLAAGIAWYGLLMITLGLMFVVVGWVGKNKGMFPSYRFKYYTFLGIAAIWLLMSFSYRAANYSPTNEVNAKNILFPIVLQYAGNEKTKKDVLEFVFPQFDLAIQQMNRENESLILRIGTFLPFFVDRNDKRIIIDNQLGYFNDLNNRFSDKNEMAQALKASGFRYIIVDLKTPDIDQTPEKTLRKKFNLLIEFLQSNDYLRLIATDSITQSEDGQNAYSLTGVKIVRRGNFAVFEII